VRIIVDDENHGNVRCQSFAKFILSPSLNWVSVSNPTPVVSVTLCDANDGAEFDGLSRQKPEMKEDLQHF
jgi:hypothetical protein